MGGEEGLERRAGGYTSLRGGRQGRSEAGMVVSFMKLYPLD